MADRWGIITFLNMVMKCIYNIAFTILTTFKCSSRALSRCSYLVLPSFTSIWFQNWTIYNNLAHLTKYLLNPLDKLTHSVFLTVFCAAHFNAGSKDWGPERNTKLAFSGASLPAPAIQLLSVLSAATLCCPLLELLFFFSVWW